MSFEFSRHTTSSGMSYLRIDASGTITEHDGNLLNAAFDDHLGGKVLSIVSKGTVYTPEVRKMFPDMSHKYCALAAVVTSPLLRAAINFMSRLAPGGGGALRMFNDEGSALEWLEAQPLDGG